MRSGKQQIAYAQLISSLKQMEKGQKWLLACSKGYFTFQLIEKGDYQTAIPHPKECPYTFIDEVE